jgi:putative phage-type endonuclease
MKMHYDIKQGSEEWHKLRLGKITASVVDNLLTSTFKVSKDKKIKLFAYNLAAERITGRLTDTFESFDMQRGKMEEPIARELYEQASGNKIVQAGFIESGILGFSPDGLVGEDGIIEIKCVQQKFQVKAFAENEIPAQHVLQIQTGLLVSGRAWCDFIQYSNGMPLFVKRMHRNAEIIQSIMNAAVDFEADIYAIIESYKANSAGALVADWVEPMPEIESMFSEDYANNEIESV